ncbi:hypothetical protein EBBID32_27560 [Sphingobium indicum BiD32]|uniref:Uncharacterized protein n=1 Tax=Sphingobium indicum BiD32 TaxID=1301087 RepID=N1MSK4_9SPHN|nr:hypothetical protein EBBID32_27560 [Sphingobium indicum BiD32]
MERGFEHGADQTLPPVAMQYANDLAGKESAPSRPAPAMR